MDLNQSLNTAKDCMNAFQPGMNLFNFNHGVATDLAQVAALLRIADALERIADNQTPAA